MKKYLVEKYPFQLEDEPEVSPSDEWIIAEHKLHLLLENEEEHVMAYPHRVYHVLDDVDEEYTLKINKTPVKTKVTYNENV